VWIRSSVIESFRIVRDRLSQLIHRVQLHHERVVVTENGTPAAVPIGPEDSSR